MAWKIIVKFTKPNNSVEFEVFSENERQYLYDNYEVISFVITYSDDGLIKYHTRIFKDVNSRNEFLTDLNILTAVKRIDGVNMPRNISRSVSIENDDGNILNK